MPMLRIPVHVRAESEAAAAVSPKRRPRSIHSHEPEGVAARPATCEGRRFMHRREVSWLQNLLVPYPAPVQFKDDEPGQVSRTGVYAPCGHHRDANRHQGGDHFVTRCAVAFSLYLGGITCVDLCIPSGSNSRSRTKPSSDMPDRSWTMYPARSIPRFE